MKKNLLIFTILLKLTFSLNSIPNRFSSFYENINNVTDFSNICEYSFELPNSIFLSYKGEFHKLNDNTWNRKGRKSKMYWLSKYKLSKNYDATIHFDYSYSIDRSNYSDALNYELKEKRRETGINLSYKKEFQEIKTGVSYLHYRQNDIQNQNEFYLSNGYHDFFEYSFDSSEDENSFIYDLYYRKTDLDFNWAENFGTNLYWGKQNLFSANVVFTKENSKVYEFQQKSDNLNKNFSYFDLSVNRELFSFIEVKLNEMYRYNKIEYKNKTSKNYDKSEFDSSLLFRYSLFGLKFTNEPVLEFYNKDYSDSENKMFKRTKNLNSSITSYFSTQDSIVYLSQMKLEQTYNPENDHYWDNDIAKNLNQLSFYYHYKEPIFMYTHLYYNKSEEIYVSSAMSGKNKIKETYKLQPALDIKFSPFVSLKQTYLLQADYDDYDWDEIYTDRYFRRFKAEYLLEFSNKSFTRNYYQFQMKYSYEDNDSGEKQNDYYLKTNQSIIKKYDLYLGFRQNNLVTIFEPSLIENIEREYIPKLTIEYNLGDNAAGTSLSSARLRISPTFSKSEETFWKIDFEVEYEF